MPRLARLDAPGILHHVMGRGIERKEIFFNDTDRSDFIDRLPALVEEGAMESELGYSGADVARYSGVTNSCVTRFHLTLSYPAKSLMLMILSASYECPARTLSPLFCSRFVAGFKA